MPTLRMQFRTQSLLNITQLMVPKSPSVWKNIGGWGCRSEQAPLRGCSESVIEIYVQWWEIFSHSASSFWGVRAFGPYETVL